MKERKDEVKMFVVFNDLLAKGDDGDDNIDR